MAKRTYRRRRTERRKRPTDPTARVAYIKEENRLNQLALRAEVYAAYGSACVCCGETEPEFLNLDHINGGGTKERAKHNNGRNLWLHLRRNGFPSGYQLLCANCNQARKYGKTCPHELAKSIACGPTGRPEKAQGRSPGHGACRTTPSHWDLAPTGRAEIPRDRAD